MNIFYLEHKNNAMNIQIATHYENNLYSVYRGHNNRDINI